MHVYVLVMYAQTVKISHSSKLIQAQLLSYTNQNLKHKNLMKIDRSLNKMPKNFLVENHI